MILIAEKVHCYPPLLPLFHIIFEQKLLFLEFEIKKIKYGNPEGRATLMFDVIMI